MSNFTFLIRSFQDKKFQNKQVDYNSDRLLYLTCKNFEYVTILASEEQIFLIHRNKSELQNSFLSNISDEGGNNEKTKQNKKKPGKII